MKFSPLVFGFKMPKCSVVNCHSGYRGFPTQNDIRWFRFPKAQAKREQWEFRLHRKDFKVSNETRICSLHFQAEDYIPDTENRDSSGRIRKKRHLKQSAVPSLHMGKCKCPIHHKPEKTSKLQL